MSIDAGERNGTRAIERSIALLREIAGSAHLGWSLSDLAERCELSKSTTHRILSCLVTEKLVRQRADRHYIPGPALFDLGLSALPERSEFEHAARTRLAALARQTGGVAFLFFRSGDDSVCATRVGTARLEAKATIFLGFRRPLALSAGGVAMLLAMPEPEAQAIIERNFAALPRYKEVSSPEPIRAMLQHCFDEGFAFNHGELVPGMNSFGLALRDPSGSPFASISLAGPARSFPLERLDEIRELLQLTVDSLQGART